MNKIFLVVRREYISRVRKKSFIVMTILAPLLVIGFYSVLIYFSLNRDIGESQKKIYVSDASGLFAGKLTNSPALEFTYGTVPAGKEQALLDEGYYGLLIVPAISTSNTKGIRLVAKEQASISTTQQIENQLETRLRNIKMDELGIRKEVLDEVNKPQVKLKTEISSAGGIESGNSSASSAIGFAGALVIYMFILLYGIQVMRGVIEEKTNRIVEVIISSIRPFDLMMGKIIGIALVGLTQFVIWVLLVTVLGGGIGAAMHFSADGVAGMQNASGNEAADLVSGLTHFRNYPLLIGMFLFYFLSGYLFYGALFAAIGSAVDNETDTQQFMFPVTLPLLFAFALAPSVVMSNPGSTLAFWLSVIPFTSPVVMMVRLPFDVPWGEIVLSMCCMIAGFVFTVWLAARIYRVGILMYGKKVTYRELSKWLFYKA